MLLNYLKGHSGSPGFWMWCRKSHHHHTQSEASHALFRPPLVIWLSYSGELNCALFYRWGSRSMVLSMNLWGCAQALSVLGYRCRWKTVFAAVYWCLFSTSATRQTGWLGLLCAGPSGTAFHFCLFSLHPWMMRPDGTWASWGPDQWGEWCFNSFSHRPCLMLGFGG